MSNKFKTVAVMLAFIALVTITTGVTVAYFSYKGVGATENTISSGAITFHYKELKGKGRGINITDALPVSSNENAKSSNNYFDFRITSSTTPGIDIPYVVTARMNGDSDAIMGNIVDIYLTEVNGTETPTTLFSTDIVKYNNLEDYNDNPKEKIIYTDTVNVSNYEKEFRLRMWIDQNINLNTGNGQSNYNNKTFSITVNVYAVGNTNTNNGGGNQTPPTITPTITDEDNNGELSMGDLVCYDTECFYIFDIDSTGNTRMLSQHNLKVGRIYTYNGPSTPTITTIDSSEEGYGLQDSTMNAKQPESDASTNWEYHGAAKGVVAFSGSYYMYDENFNVLEKYLLPGHIDRNTCPECNYTDIYEPTVKENAPIYNEYLLEPVPQEYSIAYYVEPYKTTLEGMGVPINDIELLNFKEIESAGCAVWAGVPAQCNFIYSTSYWLASISTESNRMCLAYKGSSYPTCGVQGSEEAYDGGVRPLISVPTNTLSLN